MTMKLVHEKLENGASLTCPHRRRVLFESGVRVDCPPSSPRASFPYKDYTPPCHHLKLEDLGDQGLSVKSGQGNGESAARGPLSEPCNVSSNPEGPCVVTRSLLLTNSHAGTHADQPAHFVDLGGQSDAVMFDDRQYNGHCLLVDLSQELLKKKEEAEEKSSVDSMTEGGGMAITQQVLERVLHPLIQGHTASQDSIATVDQVQRILFCTWTNVELESIDESQWVDDFVHFDPSGARWLVSNFPNLVLIGIDTPSVDHSSAAPICDHSHGAFWAGRVAILENMRFYAFFEKGRGQDSQRKAVLDTARVSWSPHVYEAHVQTIWNPMQIHHDAKGCSVMLYTITTNE